MTRIIYGIALVVCLCGLVLALLVMGEGTIG